MPARIGFGERRRRLLQQELAHIVDQLPQLGINKAILIGALAEGQVGPNSNIELIIVQDTKDKFTARADFFYSHLQVEAGMDVFVYTPEEFKGLETSNRPLWHAIQRGTLFYEA